ncbi:sensor histidine kinase [Salipiger profundus]|uniref:sensor histidine kinase n=1 Tax=Salipiger profundus TaxID=1229727 RepID=UPI0008E94AF8|nr:sensor histidine kinase [Salipiger profundus]SFD94581.1 two-component system, OmpR family, sensor histidine kinase TctE [Salipiger profundus]
MTLIPLVALASALSLARYLDARATAERIFDRGMLGAALAISRDVAMFSGDALSPSVQNSVDKAAGGRIFYHVTGPGGFYRAGYASPPSSLASRLPLVERDKQFFFDAVYHGGTVRVLRIVDEVNLPSGLAMQVVHVWQRAADREAFAAALAIRTAGILGAFIVVLAIAIWVSVGYGLAPLLQVSHEISNRHEKDLRPLDGSAPYELQPLVRRLNELFARLSESLEAHRAFIADASHQIRNPVSSILASLENVRDGVISPEDVAYQDRLLGQVQYLARLSNQLLSLERVTYLNQSADFSQIDLNKVTEAAYIRFIDDVQIDHVDFGFSSSLSPLYFLGNEILIQEAIYNLLDNALKHGGVDLRHVMLKCFRENGYVAVNVSNDGHPLSPKKKDYITSRFTGSRKSSSTGLGLTIVKTVIERHEGHLRIENVSVGASITILAPATESAVFEHNATK